MMEYGSGSSLGFHWILGLLSMLWVILLIAGMVALIKFLMGEIADTNHKRHSPLETAKERYARGEIDKQEYDTLRKDLK